MENRTPTKYQNNRRVYIHVKKKWDSFLSDLRTSYWNENN
jgi:hypothetical protein